MQHEIYAEKKFFSWLHVNLCGRNIYFPIFFKTFLRAPEEYNTLNDITLTQIFSDS